MSHPFFNRKDVLIDLSHRCPLGCTMCQRQIYFKGKFGNKVWGNDLPMRSIEMLTDKFKYISLGGQLSDPIHYPKFIEVLKMCKDKNVEVLVQTASSFKPEDWYIKAFKANNKARWQFGLDGLPSESHKYRINQDGEKIFRIMCEAKKHLQTIPVWQYIVFKYNEDHIEDAKRLAKKNKLKFVLMKSSRWLKGETDHLKPSEDNSLDTTHGELVTTTKRFKPVCIEKKIDMAVTNRNQLLPCCYIDNPHFLEDSTINQLAKSSDISKHNSLEDITNNKEWVELKRKIQEASESQDVKNVPWPCVHSCSHEQRRAEWEE